MQFFAAVALSFAASISTDATSFGKWSPLRIEAAIRDCPAGPGWTASPPVMRLYFSIVAAGLVEYRQVRVELIDEQAVVLLGDLLDAVVGEFLERLVVGRAVRAVLPGSAVSSGCGVIQATRIFAAFAWSAMPWRPLQ